MVSCLHRVYHDARGMPDVSETADHHRRCRHAQCADAARAGPEAATTVRVNLERTRRGSRARIAEPANVAVAIPLDHPDAPGLLRPGNLVLIEGILERYLAPLRGAEVERAVTALDDDWAAQQAGLRENARRDAERRYNRQRRRLQETTRTRVVAGYVELRAGTPATVEEAQELRAAGQRNRRTDQQRRLTRRSNGTAEHHAEPADTTAADAAAPETDDEQPEAR